MIKRIISIYAYKIIGVGIIFFNQILLARILGVTEYGLYLYILSINSLLVMISKLGFDNSFVKFISIYFKSKKWEYLLGLIVLGGSIALGLSVILGGGIGFLGTKVSLGKISTSLLFFLIILVPVSVIANLVSALLRGIHEQVIAEFLESICRPVFFSLIVLLTGCVLHRKLTVSNVLMFSFFSAILISLIGFILFIKKFFQVFIKLSPLYKAREWITTSLALWFSGGMYIIQSQSDIVMLGALKGPDAVAFYGVASRISGFMIFGLAAVTTFLSPRIASEYAAKNYKQIQKELEKASKFLLLYTLSLGSILILFGRDFLRIFGRKFEIAYWPLVVLVCGRIIDVAAGPVGQIMAMTGHHWMVTRFLMIATIINLFLNAVLIPIWGALGASIATAFTFAFWNTTLLMYVWRHLNLNPSILPLHFK